MLRIKQIYDKEKYIDLILEADSKKVVEKYIKNTDMYGLFEDDKLLVEIIITKVDYVTILYKYKKIYIVYKKYNFLSSTFEKTGKILYFYLFFLLEFIDKLRNFLYNIE